MQYTYAWRLNSRNLYLAISQKLTQKAAKKQMCPMLMNIAHFNGLSLCVHYVRPSYESIKEKSLLLFDFIQQQLCDNGIFWFPWVIFR